MEFQAFSKIPRLNREVIITEKLDGTNAQIYIEHLGLMPGGSGAASMIPGLIVEGPLCMMAGSRNRWLSHNSDNFGFWNWVNENSSALFKLGPGRHFGEWWGQGIQRGYGLDHKRFSLFNTHRWNPVKYQAKDEKAEIKQNPFNLLPQLDVVPILYQGSLFSENGDYDTYMPHNAIMTLKSKGSKAVPGFMNPEGIIVYHTAANAMFKVTCENDSQPKSVSSKGQDNPIHGASVG